MVYISAPSQSRHLRMHNSLPWVYIGSYKGLLRSEKILGVGKRRFIGRRLQGIVESVKNNFVDFIGKLSAQQKDKIIWYSSRMASKSISQTSIFHQYVYLKFIERLSEEEKRDILVISDDHELLRNIKKTGFRNVKILPGVSGRSCFLESIKGYLRVLRFFLIWFIYRIWRNKGTGEFNVFIHSFIDNRSFNRLPEFNDCFFGDLEHFLKGKGYNVGRLLPLRLRLRHLFRANLHFKNIVSPLSFLLFGDLLKCAFTAFTCSIDNEGLKGIKDLDLLNILFENERSKENRGRGFLDYLLLYYAYKNLSLRVNSRASIIYPFENQPWEKMLNLAFVDLKRIAYQHSTIPHNWLDYYVSDYEDKSLLPKVILTSGPVWSEFLRKHYQESLVAEAGAIRYSYLFDLRKTKQRSSRTGNIIVALPISPSISFSLEGHILKALSFIDLDAYKIQIKPHPYLHGNLGLKRDFKAYKNCAFVNTDMGELLAEGILLITSESSVAFESVFMGIKTLYFIPEGLTLGLEYFIKDHLFIAYEEDFTEKLTESLRSSKYPDARVEDYFSRPDYNVFLGFLHNN